jgi:hypothetical protein
VEHSMANASIFKELRCRSLKVDALVPRSLQPGIGRLPPSTVALHFSPRAATRLQQLALNYADGSNSEVVRKALYLYDWCQTVTKSGASLLLKSSDGRIREVRLP